MANENLYAILGVPANATGQEIRAAYQELVGQATAGQLAAAQRQAIEAAYETLSDPIRRLRYDAQAQMPPPPRFQMPQVSFPRRRFNVQLPSLAGRPVFRRAALPHVDPLVAAVIALVVVVALFAVLAPLLFRSNKAKPAPQEAASQLVVTASPSPAPTVSISPVPAFNLSPVASPAASPVASATPRPSATVSSTPSSTATRAPTSSLFLPGASPTPAPQTLASEPPFISPGLFQDAFRAVVAASAVQNGPSTGTLPAAAAPVQPVGPAGVPITTPPNVGVVAPAGAAAATSALGSATAGNLAAPVTSGGAAAGASAGQPQGATGSTAASIATPAPLPPTPSPSPQPNRIVVLGTGASLPSGATGPSGAGVAATPAAAGISGRPAAPATAGPNRFVAPPAVSP